MSKRSGKISMTLNNFSTMQPSEYGIYIKSNESIIKGIPWIIMAKLKKNIEIDYLSYFIGPKKEMITDEELEKILLRQN